MPLMPALPQFGNAVLVAGCQRSGTTALTRLIAGSAGFRGFAFTKDDELDAALVLAGLVELPRGYRYCFQSTYINENFAEYATISADQRLIWILREPCSVIHSMVYNWSRFALNELYVTCGETPEKREARHRASRYPWPLGESRLLRAASAYAGKAVQIEHILQLVDRNQILVLDYADLVASPSTVLARVFAFIDEPYASSYASKISRSKAADASSRRSRKVRSVASARPQMVYERLRGLLSEPAW